MRSLTVASFNLHWGRRPRTYTPYDVVASCRELDADVLALQEVWRPDGHESIADEVAAALGYDVHQSWTGRAVVDPKCHLVSRADDSEGDGDWGHAVLARVPHTATTEHRLRGFVRDPVARTVITMDVPVDGRTITVCASHFPHLEHFSPLLRWRLRGVVPDVHEPAVLMGDLNMWRWVTRFVVPGWHDTAKGATWPAPRPFFQIDHLLTTPRVVATDAEVVVTGGSDHLPVRARVSLRDA